MSTENGRRRQKEEDQRNDSVKKTQPTVDGFEDGGRVQEPRSVGSFSETPEGMQPCQSLILAK